MPLSSRLLRPVAVPLAACALALSACGGSGGDPSADPAAIVPAATPVYLEANLKPGDDVKELGKKLSGEEDPGAAFKRWFEKEVADENPGFKFSEDVDPWLGERAAIFAPKITVGGESAVGAIFATKDADKAKEALENTLREGDSGEKPRVETREHQDTEYFVDTTDGDAAAIVDEYAVAGNEAAIKAAIDQSSGDADALADTSEYKKARDSIEADGIGFAYVRLSQLFSALGPQGAVLRQGLKGFGETIALGLDADESKIEAETASLGVTGESAASGPGEVMAQLPSSSWFAVGVADVGTRINQAIDQFTQLGALGGQNPEQLLDQIEAQLGLDPRRDLASWMGDIGLFAFGDTLAEAGAGLIAKSKRPAATRRSIPRIARFLVAVADMRARPLNRSGIDTGVTLRSPQVPVPIHVALTDDDRFIVAVTDPALAQALRQTEPLGESQAFQDATESLGEMEPQLFVNFAPLAGFAEGVGAGSAPAGKKAIEALKKLTTLAAGSEREGDVSRGRLVVGVK